MTFARWGEGTWACRWNFSPLRCQRRTSWRGKAIGHCPGATLSPPLPLGENLVNTRDPTGNLPLQIVFRQRTMLWISLTVTSCGVP